MSQPASSKRLQLAKRSCFQGTDGNVYCTTAWDDWVRWVILGVILLGFFFLVIVCGCISARRRRRAGRQPFYGTGWTAQPTPFQHGNNNNNNAQPHYGNYPQYGQPAPPYNQSGPGNYYAPPPSNGPGYFNQQQNGVELQNQGQYAPPPAAYHRPEEGVYTPPTGAPAGKGDGVVR